jgi:serine/threonine protein kinase
MRICSICCQEHIGVRDDLTWGTNDDFLADLLFVRIIGQGNFGKVLLYTDAGSREKIAVKLIEKKDIGSDVTRLKALRRVEGHREHISSLIDFAQMRDPFAPSQLIYAIKMTYAGDVNLRTLVYDPFDKHEPLQLVMKSALATLAFVHRANIVHSDIKPENLMWDGTRVRLVDFGMSCQDACPSVGGSPKYMAPELFAGWPNATQTKQSDVFSLGAVFYYLFCGPDEATRNDTLRQIRDAAGVRQIQSGNFVWLTQIAGAPVPARFSRGLLEGVGSSSSATPCSTWSRSSTPCFRMTLLCAQQLKNCRVNFRHQGVRSSARG